MLERQWQTIDKVRVDDLKSVLSELCGQGGKIVHIGTDSQQAASKTAFVTVISVLTPGKGGRAFFTKEIVPRISSLRERLQKEAWMSLDTAMDMLAEGMVNQGDITIHVDANPNEAFKSSTYVKELTAMVVSQGFSLKLKPDSWCATHVADHTVKHRVLDDRRGRRARRAERARMN